MNSDKLDNLDSTDFLRITGKAADAETLDGLDSTSFLGRFAKASDSDRLDGRDSESFQERCQEGAVKGFVKVLGSSTFPSSPTTDAAWIPQWFNCQGSSVNHQVRVERNGVGHYTVNFRSSFPSGIGIAVGSVLANSADNSGQDDFISVQHWMMGAGFTQPTSWLWDVYVRDADGGLEDAHFYLVVL